MATESTDCFNNVESLKMFDFIRLWNIQLYKLNVYRNTI